MIKFLKSNYFLAFIAVALAGLVFGADVLAQAVPVPDASEVPADSLGQSTGPFAKFLARAAHLFQVSRNALFVVAAFVFIGFAWNAINKGSIEWEKIAYLLIGLVLLGVAGFIVAYMADPSGTENLQTGYGLHDKAGWGT
ncbi:MAG: hypothetical protein LBL52_01465 [Rickettsiales bacterium]|jgi:hypothetical protein|nr:hypothetical protein [Rickettsiales bacterium]